MRRGKDSDNSILIMLARGIATNDDPSTSWTRPIFNRLYCHGKLGKTPYELLNGRKPNIAYFRVFGCKCYILKKSTRLSKFEKKCDKWFLLGYSNTSKAYRVCNLASGTLEEVHDVEFDETEGSQSEAQNLDDVRGDQLANAMKNTDVGDIRPVQVDDDNDIHMINQEV